MFRLARDQLDNGAGNTGESPLEVRRNDVDIGYPHHFAHHLRFATRERKEFSIVFAPWKRLPAETRLSLLEQSDNTLAPLDLTPYLVGPGDADSDDTSALP